MVRNFLLRIKSDWNRRCSISYRYYMLKVWVFILSKSHLCQNSLFFKKLRRLNFYTVPGPYTLCLENHYPCSNKQISNNSTLLRAKFMKLLYFKLYEFSAFSGTKIKERIFNAHRNALSCSNKQTSKKSILLQAKFAELLYLEF